MGLVHGAILVLTRHCIGFVFVFLFEHVSPYSVFSGVLYVIV